VRILLAFAEQKRGPHLSPVLHRFSGSGTPCLAPWCALGVPCGHRPQENGGRGHGAGYNGRVLAPGVSRRTNYRQPTAGRSGGGVGGEPSCVSPRERVTGFSNKEYEQ
jgi:hypothetical protein